MATKRPSIGETVAMAESYPDFQMEYEQLAEQGSLALLRGDFAGYAEAARLLACKVNRIQAGDAKPSAATTCIRWPHTPGAWSACAGANYRLLEADAAEKGGRARRISISRPRCWAQAKSANHAVKKAWEKKAKKS